MPSTPEPHEQWYVLHVLSGQENSVRDRIIRKAKDAELSDFIYRVEVPTELISEVRNGKKTERHSKLFPGYVYANMYLLDGLESDHLGMCDIDLGLYFSYPLSSRFLIGSKLLAGQRTNANFTLNSISRINPAIFDRQKVSQEAYDQFYKADVDYYIQQEGLSVQEMLQSTFIDEEFLHIRKSSTFKLGTGLSLAYRYKENAALRLYCDYDFASPRLTYDLKNSWANEDGNREVRSYSKRTPMHNFTFGASIAFMF